MIIDPKQGLPAHSCSPNPDTLFSRRCHLISRMIEQPEMLILLQEGDWKPILTNPPIRPRSASPASLASPDSPDSPDGPASPASPASSDSPANPASVHPPTTLQSGAASNSADETAGQEASISVYPETAGLTGQEASISVYSETAGLTGQEASISVYSENSTAAVTNNAGNGPYQAAVDTAKAGTKYPKSKGRSFLPAAVEGS